MKDYVIVFGKKLLIFAGFFFGILGFAIILALTAKWLISITPWLVIIPAGLLIIPALILLIKEEVTNFKRYLKSEVEDYRYHKARKTREHNK